MTAITNNLDQANKLLKQLRANFLAELPEKLDQYEPIILSLTRPENYHEAYESVFRAIHSLKGSAGTHGIMTISIICHQFEDYLTDLSTKPQVSEKDVDVLLEHLDLIRRTIELAEQESANFSEIDKILDAIRQRSERGKLSMLIVEENAYMQEIIKSSLSEYPVKISLHADAMDALRILLRIKYDILITGAEAKSLNGKALHYALRASGGINRKIKTIIITSKDHPEFASGLAPDYLIRKDKELSGQLRDTVNSIINSH